jgi:DHA2 family multidrug resistance protein
LWDRREALHQSRLADTLTQYTPSYQQALTQMHLLGMNDQSAAGALAQTMVSQSYLLASIDFFYISAWLSVAMIPLCFIVRRPAGGGHAPAAAD